MSDGSQDRKLERQFQFAYSSLDDDRKLIAVGKAQRWEVTKWAVALNIGLATAAVTIKSQSAACLIAGFCVLVAAMAIGLLLYITHRMTGARNDALKIYAFMEKHDLPCDEISGKDTKTQRTWKHDGGELALYIAILFLSCCPAFIVSYELSRMSPS
jgi:hypothetical protein